MPTEKVAEPILRMYTDPQSSSAPQPSSVPQPGPRTHTSGTNQPGADEFAAFPPQAAELPGLGEGLQPAWARANCSSHDGYFHSCHL